jgi:hypothetical protein
MRSIVFFALFGYRLITLRSASQRDNSSLTNNRANRSANRNLNTEIDLERSSEIREQLQEGMAQLDARNLLSKNGKHGACLC